MKKIPPLFFILFSLQIPLAFANESTQCPAPAESLDPLDSKNSKSIEVLEVQVRNSACNTESVFSKVNDPKFTVNHNRLRCSEIENCMVGTSNKEVIKDATELMKENLPKAILLGVLDNEINAELKYNILLKRFEDSHHEKVCPGEKVASSCEKEIRAALSSVSGSFIGHLSLDIGPASDESLEGYFSKNFLSDNIYKKKSMSKEELSSACGKKISFIKICNDRDKRLVEISNCEKNQSKGCLDQEQNALASLLNSQKNNPAVFLAMEKQLCTSTRMVYDSPSQSTIGQTYPLSGKAPDLKQHLGLKMNHRPFGVFSNDTDTDSNSGFKLKASTSADNELAEEKSGNRPDASGVIPTESLRVDVSRAPASDDKISDEIKGFNSQDTSTLSEKFSNSLQESFNTNNKTITNNTPNTNTTSNWNTEFSSRLNEEENKKKEKEDVTEDTSLSSADKKKKEEMNALTTQINGLKTKLEEMNQNVEDLKAKKDVTNTDKDKIEKDALEREKSILDLKKKLAELEADKKKMQEDSIAKKDEEEKNRSRAEAVKAKSNAATSALANRLDTEKADTGKREREKNANSNNQSSGSFSEGRAPASISGPQAISGPAIVLHSVGTQAGPESSVVYMTAVELQKYPYHLNDNASSGEIEKMILGNNGASIILGNSEQIIPVVVKGVVQLDENGHVKYKRIKISLVKNERERKQSIAREISSIADLKREDQKKRELIRYQEMKKIMKKATE